MYSHVPLTRKKKVPAGLVPIYSFMPNEVAPTPKNTGELIGYADFGVTVDDVIGLFNAASIEKTDDFVSTYGESARLEAEDDTSLPALAVKALNKIAATPPAELSRRLTVNLRSKGLSCSLLKLPGTTASLCTATEEQQQFIFIRQALQLLSSVRLAFIDGMHRAYAASCFLADAVPDPINAIRHTGIPKEWVLPPPFKHLPWVRTDGTTTVCTITWDKRCPLQQRTTDELCAFFKQHSRDIAANVAAATGRTTGNVLVDVVRECRELLMFNSDEVFGKSMDKEHFLTSYLDGLTQGLLKILLRPENDPYGCLQDTLDKECDNPDRLVKSAVYATNSFARLRVNSDKKKHAVIITVLRGLRQFVFDDESLRLFSNLYDGKGNRWLAKPADGPVVAMKPNWNIGCESLEDASKIGPQSPWVATAKEIVFHLLSGQHAIYEVIKPGVVARWNQYHFACSLRQFCLIANLGKQIMRLFGRFGCYMDAKYFHQFGKKYWWLIIVRASFDDYPPDIGEDLKETTVPTRNWLFVIADMIKQGLLAVTFDNVSAVSPGSKGRRLCYRKNVVIQDFYPKFLFKVEQFAKLQRGGMEISELVEFMVRECWEVPGKGPELARYFLERSSKLFDGYTTKSAQAAKDKVKRKAQSNSKTTLDDEIIAVWNREGGDDAAAAHEPEAGERADKSPPSADAASLPEAGKEREHLGSIVAVNQKLSIVDGSGSGDTNLYNPAVQTLLELRKGLPAPVPDQRSLLDMNKKQAPSVPLGSDTASEVAKESVHDQLPDATKAPPAVTNLAAPRIKFRVPRSAEGDHPRAGPAQQSLVDMGQTQRPSMPLETGNAPKEATKHVRFQLPDARTATALGTTPVEKKRSLRNQPSASSDHQAKKKKMAPSETAEQPVAKLPVSPPFGLAYEAGPTRLERYAPIHGQPRLIFRKAMARVLHRRAIDRDPPFVDSDKGKFWELVLEEIKRIVGNRQLRLHQVTVQRMCEEDGMLMVHPKYQMSDTKDVLDKIGMHAAYLVEVDDLASVGDFGNRICSTKFQTAISKNKGKVISYGGDNIRFVQEGWHKGHRFPHKEIAAVLGGISREAKALFKDCVKHFNDDMKSKGIRKKEKTYDESNLVLFKVSLLWSQIDQTSARKNSEEQDPHVDYRDEEVEKVYKDIGLKPLSTFAPVTEDGMALRVWTKDGQRAPVLFVPLGVVLYLWGDTYHAGGFCFGPRNNERIHCYVIPMEDGGFFQKSLEAGIDGSFYPTEHSKISRLKQPIDTTALSILTEELLDYVEVE
jgi:hypothetical protein